LLAALFQLSDALQVAAASAVRGYKVTRTPMLIHLIAFWGISLPLGCILGYGWLPAWVPGAPSAPMEATGFWIGLVVGLSFAGGALAWFLARLSNQRVA
jgi:MATE family multidrug resistance protein